MSECSCETIIIEMTPEGVDGNGIVGIALISTAGRVKTYRITFTNGTAFDFEVTDGANIVSITKTSSSGLVDTYTVLLSDGTSTTFQVTNGNGISGITKIGSAGLADTYRISFTNGQYFDYEVTNGKGITSIEKTSTSGLNDTYTITFNDGSTSAFVVTNGMPATHSWNGTVLTVTSASGTSSADLKGDKGDAATIAVGTVSTGAEGSSASVSNSGDEHSAVFDFSIPRGNTGNGITSISLLSTSGLIKTYRVTYTNGDHFDFSVADGNGIASIAKTATAGLVDTYTITFTDGTTTTFDVTNGSDQWGNITGTLSDQTDLQGALNEKLDAHDAVLTGDIVTFEAENTHAIKGLSVKIKPVQDLHGYDSPWPAGSGKNLIPDGNDSSNGYVNNNYLKNDDTLVSSMNLYVSEYFQVQPSTVYTFSARKSVNAPAICFYDSDKNFISGQSCDNLLSQQITTPADAVYARSSQCKYDAVNLYQFELGSEGTAILPYSNICPITGFNKADIFDDPVYGGKIVWNQLARDRTQFTQTSYEVHGVTLTINENGSYTLTGANDGNSNRYFDNIVESAPCGHVYLIGNPNTTNSNSGGASGGYNLFLAYDGSTASFKKVYAENTPLIFKPSNSANGMFHINIQFGHASAGITFNDTFFPYCFDLTMMFGEEKADEILAMETAEPGAGVAWFKSLFPEDWYPYNEGTVTSVSAVNGTISPVTVSWTSEAGTVYGGTLNVLTGELTVTHVYYTVTSVKRSNAHQFYKSYSTLMRYAYGTDNIICDRFPTLDSNPGTGAAVDGINTNNNGDFIVHTANSYETAEAMMTAVGGEINFVCALATPTTVQLPQSEVASLIGLNNLLADTGGTTVTLQLAAGDLAFQDVVDYETQVINKPDGMIADTEDAMTASRNYTAGEFLICGNKMYKVTANIANGGTITEGTNVQQTTVAEQLVLLFGLG